MSNSKPKLSVVGSRAPFGRVTRLEQIPSAMFEILVLAKGVETSNGTMITRLVEDVINVALEDPETWLKFKNLASEEYKNAISRLES